MIQCLFIMHSFGGGAEIVTANLTNNIDRSLFSPTVASVMHVPLLRELFPDASVPVLMPDDGSPVAFVRNLLRIRRLAQKNDVVIGTLELQSILWAALFGLRKSVAWLHKDLGPYLAARNALHRIVYTRLVRWAVKRCGRLVCVSPGVADSARALCPDAAEKITVLFNPVDIANVRQKAQMPLQPELETYFRHPVILSVGRLEPQKDHSTLLRAFAQFRKSHPTHVLCILGEGSLRDELLREASALGLDGFFFLPGFRMPFPAMRCAEAFVLCSVFEGYPSVILEAMACDLPVVSTDCPSGPAFLLRNGSDGMLCPVGDHKSIAKALDDMTEPETRAVFAAKSLRRAKDFSMSSALRDWEALLRDIHGGYPATHP